MGEWTRSLSCRMSSAVDGDCFVLPTPIHLHAFETLAEEGQFADKKFRVKLASEKV